MRNVPNKLVRERGQNLRPFILNILANILASQNSINSYQTTNTKENSPKLHHRTISEHGYFLKFLNLIIKRNLILILQFRSMSSLYGLNSCSMLRQNTLFYQNSRKFLASNNNQQTKVFLEHLQG